MEMHLATLHKLANDFHPRVVIVDPITTFLNVGTSVEAESMLMRLIDFLKAQQITALFTSLTHGGDHLEQSQTGISSLIDTWLLVRDIELGGERNRGLYVLKSRGMAHSNQIREYLLTDHGVELKDVYVGPEGVLTGSMRWPRRRASRPHLSRPGDRAPPARLEPSAGPGGPESRPARPVEAEQDELKRPSPRNRRRRPRGTDREQMARSPQGGLSRPRPRATALVE